jgi:hypothetical protein
LQFINGGSDYTIDHNTAIFFPVVPLSAVAVTVSTRARIENFVFTNNLFARPREGFSGSGIAPGIPTLNANFTNWTFSRNVIVGQAPGAYPQGNFFPADVAEVRFVNYADGNYALAANSPYRNAGTGGTAIGVDYPL